MYVLCCRIPHARPTLLLATECPVTEQQIHKYFGLAHLVVLWGTGSHLDSSPIPCMGNSLSYLPYYYYHISSVSSMCLRSSATEKKKLKYFADGAETVNDKMIIV